MQPFNAKLEFGVVSILIIYRKYNDKFFSYCFLKIPTLIYHQIKTSLLASKVRFILKTVWSKK
jgi:hypothetical protein